MLEHTCRLPAEHVPAGPARARTAALSRFRRRRAGECTKTRAHGGAESRGGRAEADALLQSTLSRSALALLQSTLSHSALALLQSTLALPPRRKQASPSPSARHSLSLLQAFREIELAESAIHFGESAAEFGSSYEALLKTLPGELALHYKVRGIAPLTYQPLPYQPLHTNLYTPASLIPPLHTKLFHTKLFHTNLLYTNLFPYQALSIPSSFHTKLFPYQALPYHVSVHPEFKGESPGGIQPRFSRAEMSWNKGRGVIYDSPLVFF